MADPSIPVTAPPRLTPAEQRGNALVVVALGGLHAGALVLAALAGGSGALLAALLIALVTPTLWAAVHEAIHGHLLVPRASNDAAGRLLAILHGAPFDVLRFGHLTHHRTNGEPAARPDLPPADRPLRWTDRLAYYARLFGAVYLAEIATVPLALLPRAALGWAIGRLGGALHGAEEARRAARHVLEPARLARIRTDSLAVLALWGGAFWLCGEAWPSLLAGLAGRALIVSLLDNAPHYAGEVDNRDQGHDTRLPGPLAALFLHMNLHGTHHRHPNLPWRHLPRAFAADRARCHGPLLRAVLRQLAGPRHPA